MQAPPPVEKAKLLVPQIICSTEPGQILQRDHKHPSKRRLDREKFFITVIVNDADINRGNTAILVFTLKKQSAFKAKNSLKISTRFRGIPHGRDAGKNAVGRNPA
jgi:hypothetical protein